MCSKCYQSVGHVHKMEQMDFGLGNGGSPGGNSSNNKSSNRPVQRCMQSLVHACQCKNANCNMVACKKMKRVSLFKLFLYNGFQTCNNVLDCLSCKILQKKNKWFLSNLQTAYCVMLLSRQTLPGMICFVAISGK